MTVKLFVRCSVAVGLTLAASFVSPALAQSPPATTEAAFLAENEAAMAKMMADMNVKPTGDVDCDFVAMMIPHHQGAIEMAKAMLRYGHNEQLRRMAQEIIVTQQQEIAAMKHAIDETVPAAAPAKSQPAPDSNSATGPDHSTSHNSMHMK